MLLLLLAGSMIELIDHHDLVPVSCLFESCLTAWSWFSLISLLILSWSIVTLGFCFCPPFRRSACLRFRRCFTKGDMKGGSLDDISTVFTGKQTLYICISANWKFCTFSWMHWVERTEDHLCSSSSLDILIACWLIPCSHIWCPSLKDYNGRASIDQTLEFLRLTFRQIKWAVCEKRQIPTSN